MNTPLIRNAGSISVFSGSICMRSVRASAVVSAM
jgi:hypothetical protein